MFPYLLLLFSSLVISIISRYAKWKANITMMVYFIMLCIILSCRNVEIGNDTIPYMHTFYQISSAPWHNLDLFVREIGYGIFNKIVSYFTSDFQIFLAFNAVIITVPLYYLFKSPNRNNYLKITIFMNMAIFPMIFSGLRQTIAISLGIWAFFALLNKKQWIFFLLVFIGYYFHHSAIILLLLYPISLFKIKKVHLLFLIPAFLFLFAMKAQITYFMMQAMATSDDLAVYKDRYGEISETGAYGTLVLFIIFTIMTYVFPNDKKLTPKSIFLRNIMVIATFFQLVALVNPVMMRINYYFIVFVPTALPICLDACRKRDRLVTSAIKTSLCIILTLFYLNRAFNGIDILNIYPFYPFWA